MRYICTICHAEAVHNEKLGIHFCSQHGFSTSPDISGHTDFRTVVGSGKT